MPGQQILRVLVGSRAHGLHTANSDYDYRGVFVLPTSQILALGNKPQQTSWIEGKDDDTSWELGHFLHLASHCNPTILETLAAPVTDATPEGIELRALFPYLWQPTRVRDAFCGYGYNQRKKFLEEKDNRSPKYAVAYLRVLEQARVLLLTGELLVDMSKSPVYETLKRWKNWSNDDIDYGEVVGRCKAWELEVQEAYDLHMQEPQVPDLDRVNEYLLRVRRAHWDG